MTSEEKKLLQAKHRLEEAQARDRVKERKARTRRLIQEGAVLEKVLPEVQAVGLDNLEEYLRRKLQDTIENGWEVSGKPGAFLFFIPKGALTHHLLKQAVVAFPLVGHVRSPRGIVTPAGAAGQGCISAKLPALPMQSAQGFPFWKPLFMGWYIATPSRRLRQPATGSLTQIQGRNESFHPCWWYVAFHDVLSENKGALFRGTPFRKDKVIYGDLSFGGQDGQPWSRTLRRGCCGLSELFPNAQRV